MRTLMASVNRMKDEMDENKSADGLDNDEERKAIDRRIMQQQQQQEEEEGTAVSAQEKEGMSTQDGDVLGGSTHSYGSSASQQSRRGFNRGGFREQSIRRQGQQVPEMKQEERKKRENRLSRFL